MPVLTNDPVKALIEIVSNSALDISSGALKPSKTAISNAIDQYSEKALNMMSKTSLQDKDYVSKRISQTSAKAKAFVENLTDKEADVLVVYIAENSGKIKEAMVKRDMGTNIISEEQRLAKIKSVFPDKVGQRCTDLFEFCGVYSYAVDKAALDFNNKKKGKSSAASETKPAILGKPSAAIDAMAILEQLGLHIQSPSPANFSALGINVKDPKKSLEPVA